MPSDVATRDTLHPTGKVMRTTTLASNVSARVRSLIARHHDGDLCTAARILEMDPQRLAGILSGDWEQFSLDAFSAVVRGYGISVDWLLTPPAPPAMTRPVGGWTGSGRSTGSSPSRADAPQRSPTLHTNPERRR